MSIIPEMGHAALLTALQTYHRRNPFFESRSGVVIYLVIVVIAIVLWLGFQLRIWFGWPTPDEDKGPITLGLDDLSDRKKRNHP